MDKVILIMVMMLAVICICLGVLVWAPKEKQYFVATGSGDVTVAYSEDGVTWTGLGNRFGTGGTGQESSHYKNIWTVTGTDGDSGAKNVYLLDENDMDIAIIPIFEANNGNPFGSNPVNTSLSFAGYTYIGGEVESYTSAIYWKYLDGNFNPPEGIDFVYGQVTKIIKVIQNTNEPFILVIGEQVEGKSITYGRALIKGTNPTTLTLTAASGDFPNLAWIAYDAATNTSKNGVVVVGKNAIDTVIYYSSDGGRNWSTSTGSNFGPNGTELIVIYNGFFYLAAGRNNYSGTGGTALYSNSDGSNWTIAPIDGNDIVNGVPVLTMVNGTPKLVIGSTVYHTTDGGQSWTSNSTGIDSSFVAADLTYGRGKYVLVGTGDSDNDMYQSDDAINWTKIDSPFGTSGSLTSVNFA